MAMSEAATDTSCSPSGSSYSWSTSTLRGSSTSVLPWALASSSRRAAAVSTTNIQASEYSSGGSVTSTGSCPALK